MQTCDGGGQFRPVVRITRTPGAQRQQRLLFGWLLLLLLLRLLLLLLLDDDARGPRHVKKSGSIDNWRGEADWRFATHLTMEAGSCGRTPFEAARQVLSVLITRYEYFGEEIL